MIYVGVDPGIKGAIAILDIDGDIIGKGVYDIPVKKVDGKNKVDSEELMMLCVDEIDLDTVIICIEKVHSMPNMNSVAVFSFGETFGRICGAIEAAGVTNDFHYVVPRIWKKHFGLDSDKNKSLELARSLYPTAELHLKKHSDRAEALLIARYIYETTAKI